MRGGILDCRCARRSARRQVGTKGWSYSDRTKGWALELNSTALAHHAQFAELDAHNSAMILPSQTDATIPLPKGCKVEQYRGADWLPPRVQEPQKRRISGKVSTPERKCLNG